VLPGFNNNGGAAITANGNFCAIGRTGPVAGGQSAGETHVPMMDLATYYVTGGTATGTVTFQAMFADGTYRNLASPAALTLSANPQNGVINGPYHGFRLVVSSLAVSTISYAELAGSYRQQ